ncbi:MAG: flagellin lysine-N-methylase [Oscillospiraceae bacterium]|nr:flagellin lysine-N-methylase [Oscillospiraceae bacterium]
MKIHTPSYGDAFVCAAGTCADTCCNAWEVVVDDETRARYEAMPGPLGKRVRAALRRDSDGDSYLAFSGRGCPMLTEDGLCSLQQAFGEEALSRVCRRYPRFTCEFGALTEEGLSLSCPAACRLILETPFSITERITDAPPALNDLDPGRFYAVLRGRALAFRIAGNRAFPVRQRAALLLSLGGELEKAFDAPDAVLSAWPDESLPARLTALLPQKAADFSTLTRCFQGMEHLTARFPKLLPQLSYGPPALDEASAERLLQYFLYKYALQAACDGKLLRKLEFCAASLLMCDRLCATDPANPVGLITLYARETEHSEENLRRFARWASHTRSYLPALLLTV